MTKPFLSIVTISFNQARYLRQCLDSVISQKGDDVEYIVVDPGSTDGSREILESYGAAMDHLVLKPDKGPADGLNKGFALARGEVGYFINSDDFLMPGAVQRMRRLWRENPDLDILLGSAWMVNRAGEPLRELAAASGDLKALLSGDATVVQQGLSFRMDRLRAAGGFKVENRTCWDYEILCTMLHGGAKALVTRDRLGAFRVYGDSLSGGVGGTHHTQRYFADLDRLHRALTGRPFARKGPAAETLARARRALTHPSLTLTRFRDRLFPAHLRQRWAEDLKSSRIGQG